MSATKKENKEKEVDSIEVLDQQEIKKKTCFVIMPIADTAGYDDGHFTRVYEHLIKPACEAAGYEAVRADDSKASHMIMFDILKKIVECDMAICDLSTKNANVFYELGLRQAFNKKTILITDGKEREPFDITGFRYVKYSPSLRIDTVGLNVTDIADMLKETELADENDINSITSLLRIHPASIDKTKDIELSKENTVIFRMLNDINDKLNKVDKLNKMKIEPYTHNNGYRKTLLDVIENENDKLYTYDFIYSKNNKNVGKLTEFGNRILKFENASFSGDVSGIYNQFYVA